MVIFSISCANKKDQSDSVTAHNNQNDKLNNFETIIPISEENVIELYVEAENENHNIGEVKLQYFGSIFNTIISDFNVKIHLNPSFDADILFELNKNTRIAIIGTSKEIDTIEGYSGHWFKIAIGDHWGDSGWVFGKYIENDNIIKSELNIEGRRAQRLLASYQIGGLEKIVTLYPSKEGNQFFYTFAYDHFVETFHYSNIPGSYAWYPETNELLQLARIWNRHG
jgi:hypothetical protein